MCCAFITNRFDPKTNINAFWKLDLKTNFFGADRFSLIGLRHRFFFLELNLFQWNCQMNSLLNQSLPNVPPILHDSLKSLLEIDYKKRPTSQNFATVSLTTNHLWFSIIETSMVHHCDSILVLKNNYWLLQNNRIIELLKTGNKQRD